MRRIFTSILSVALLMAVSNANAQTATCTSYSTTGTGTYNTYPTTSSAPIATTSTYLTDIFYSNTTQSTIDFGLRLYTQGGGQNTNLQATITIRWGAGGAISYTCAASTLNGFNNSAPGAWYYFSITPNSPVPPSTNFQISIAFSKASNQRDVVVAEYRMESGALTRSDAVLPVKFGVFTAKKAGNGVNLNWTIDAEENTKSYEIERSADGRTYTKISEVAATGSRSYSAVDAAPLNNAYYRIKSVDFDGKFGYSAVVRVKGNESAVEVKAFMSNTNTITVQHDQAPAGSRVSVTTADGRMIRSVVVGTGSQQTTIDVASAKSGLLLVRFEGANGQTETIKVVKQ